MQKQLLEGQSIQKDLIAQYDPETAERYQQFCVSNIVITTDSHSRKKKEFLEKRCEVCDRIIERTLPMPSQHNRLRSCSKECSFQLRSESHRLIQIKS